jgi:Domain of unknown function (DUF222)
VVASGKLGQHNGLPATTIVSTTLKDLEAAAGKGLTGGGTLLPTTDVIRMARHAHHYLAIFGDGKAIGLYHTKRLASPGQRIVLYANKCADYALSGHQPHTPACWHKGPRGGGGPGIPHSTPAFGSPWCCPKQTAQAWSVGLAHGPAPAVGANINANAATVDAAAATINDLRIEFSFTGRGLGQGWRNRHTADAPD